MRRHRGMLGKVSSKQTAVKCAPPALYKATDELRGEKRSINIFISLLVCVFFFNFGRLRVYENLIIKALQSRKCMYL